jgi:hypothetical protein
VTVRVHHITLSKAQLDAVPEAERSLLVLMGHAANELSVLSKLLHFCARAESKAPMIMQAENAQALVLGRILAGKIYECWNLMQAGFFGSGISRTYHSKFDADELSALDALKRYFGRDNLIAKVRNEHAFHYDVSQVKAGYHTLVDGDPLDAYLSRTNANTLYAFADTIAGRSMLESITPGDPKKALDALFRETSQAIGWINTVIGAVMSTCLEAHVGGDLYGLGAKIVEIEGAPNSQVVSIPYFIEMHEEGDA